MFVTGYGIDRLKGFTLIELSIVLVIIGLLTAGIVVGAGLMRTSETKVIIERQNEMKAAITQFKTLYGGFPGDITNANKYWTGAAVGNNDGIVASEASAAPSDEAFEALRQLTLSKLIEGEYTGTLSGAFSPLPGGNVINLRLSRTAAVYFKCCANNASHRDYNRGASGLSFKNHVQLFNIMSSPNEAFRTGAVTPIEAKTIDDKIDDGKPDTGWVGGEGGYDATNSVYSASGCFTGSGDAATYVVDDNSFSCQMLFGYD